MTPNNSNGRTAPENTDERGMPVSARLAAQANERARVETAMLQFGNSVSKLLTLVSLLLFAFVARAGLGYCGGWLTEFVLGPVVPHTLGLAASTADLGAVVGFLSASIEVCRKHFPTDK